MATLTIELTEERLARFLEPARLLGVEPEDLARLSVESYLDKPIEDARRLIEEILQEHDELLRRLAK